jgi:hypothetical protein
MTNYYVGPGGSDLNNGTTWALRKLTIASGEAIPLAAGDTLYIGPGRYMLAAPIVPNGHSGVAGSPIIYHGDVTGENTDGIGGPVIISYDGGSAIYETGGGANYRTFRNLYLRGERGLHSGGAAAGWVVEDCIMEGTSQTYIHRQPQDLIVRRCVFQGFFENVVLGPLALPGGNYNALVENCVFVGVIRCSVYVAYAGNSLVRNCLFIGQSVTGAAVFAAMSLVANGLQPANVLNCIICNAAVGLYAEVLGDMIENYNSLFWNWTARTNVAVGANSDGLTPDWDRRVTLQNAHAFPAMTNGYMLPGSPLAQIIGSNEATNDLLGFARPVTAGKRSRGPIQYQPVSRDATTTRGGSSGSLKLGDAGRTQIFIPASAVSTVIACYVYREANYAGTLPQMIIRQPGQAATTVTDTGAAGGWNLLTATLTPAALPAYVIVELVSNNTAAAGSYACYFDDLTTSAPMSAGELNNWIDSTSPFRVVGGAGGGGFPKIAAGRGRTRM